MAHRNGDRDHPVAALRPAQGRLRFTVQRQLDLCGEGGARLFQSSGVATLGLGVGSAMLDQLIAAARASGMTRLSLETGNGEAFAAANRLYRREGFEPCGPFAGYRPTDFTTFYTREI